MLNEHWTNRVIWRMESLSKLGQERFIEGVSHADFMNKVVGAKVEEVRRVAKNILVVLDCNAMWHIHLSSTGWLMPVEPIKGVKSRAFLHSVGPATHRIQITFRDGGRWVYADSRSWGRWYLRRGREPSKDPYLSTFGPDWLMDPESAALALFTHRGNRTAKDVLVDQHLTSGVGNYLACEALHLAKIHPHTRWRMLHPGHVRILAKAVQWVIAEAILHSGKEHWRVFKKAGAQCELCKVAWAKIAYVKDRGDQRGSYYCPNCQALGELDERREQQLEEYAKTWPEVVPFVKKGEVDRQGNG